MGARRRGACYCLSNRSLYGIPPIIWAVLYDKPEALKTLLEFGADKNAIDIKDEPLWKRQKPLLP